MASGALKYVRSARPTRSGGWIGLRGMRSPKIPMATGTRRLMCALTFAVLALLSRPLMRTVAQANTASISVMNSFVTAAGQTAASPSGSAAGVSFTFTPTLVGQPATIVTTNSGGQAFGALSAGPYTFQESTPAPGTVFLSATISQAGGPPQTLSPGAALPFSPGGSYSIFVTNQVTGQAVAGTASLTVFKSLSAGTGQTAVGTLAGYSFTLSGQGGLPTQTQVTNLLGQASFSGIPAGVYSISEAPSPGSSFSTMTINGLAAQQQQAFQIQPGGNYDVEVTNLIGGSGNISIQEQLVDQNSLPTNGNLAGYSFSLVAQGGAGSTTTVMTGSSGLATANLAPGVYAIFQSSTQSLAPVTYLINGVPSPSGQFTVGLGQTTSIVVTTRVPAGGSSPAGQRSATLQTGCNNVVNTFPDGSPGQTVSSGISPATVVAIWKYDNASQIFRAAYFPASTSGSQPPVDIPTLNRLDAVFICVSAPATLLEPTA
jgi:hypothetical protein